MMKTLYLAAFMTAAFATPFHNAYAADSNFTVKSERSHKANRHSKRSDRHYRGSRRSNPRSSFVIINGGSRSSARASANGNSVTIGAGVGDLEIGPLNPVSNVISTDSALDELAALRSSIRRQNGGTRGLGSFTVIAGASDGGDRVPATVYMPETYETRVDDQNKVIYFND